MRHRNGQTHSQTHTHTQARLHWLSVVGLALVAGILPGGCAGPGTIDGAESSAIADRPRVAQSASEVAPGGGSGQLDFFDELEHHQLATQDDALHAVLLAFHGSSAPTYVQRAAIAKQNGYMHPKVSQQPREAATAGEVSQLLYRSLILSQSFKAVATNPPFPSTDDALRAMQALGVMPDDWRSTRGMTGAELLEAIRGTGRFRDEQQQTTATKE